MATYQQQMQELFREYQSKHTGAPADLRDVAAWAIKEQKWKPRPADIQARFASDMADALREEYRTDKRGRRYRANLAVREVVNGKNMSFWGDIDKSPRAHVEKSVGQRRSQIVADCYHLRVDVDHYNDEHPSEEPLQLILDFSDDVAEKLVQDDIDDAA